MSDIEVVALKIFGRDISLSCPAEEKDALIQAAELLNSELDGIDNKSNALILAGLSLALALGKNNIKTLFGIGGNDKSNSSSWILKKWKE